MGRIKAHPKDKMTPIERQKAIIEGEPFDRLQANPFLGEIKAQLVGKNIAEYWHHPKAIVDAEIIAFNRWGYDGVGAGANSNGIAASLGAHVKYAEKELPRIQRPVLEEYSALAFIDPQMAMKTAAIQDALWSLELLTKEAEGIVGVGTSAGGPFTIASFLIGTEKLMKDCVRQPEQIHRLMRIVTDCIKYYIDEVSIYPVGINLADPIASGQLISPRLFEQFVSPYLEEIINYAYEKTGKKASLHMCGKTYKLWSCISKWNIGSLSIDNVIDLQRAKEELGHTFTILGNVPPVEAVMLGSKEELFASIRNCIRIGRNSEKGYVIATGCDVPLHTELKQIDYFMEAVREYGRPEIAL